MRSIILAGLALSLASVARAESPAPPPPIAVSAPVWVSMPTADDIAAVYPKDALQKKLGGLAIIKCQAKANGEMSFCGIVSESPEGAGFGKAGVSLLPKFKISPKFDDGTPVEGGWVIVPLRFKPPA